MSQIEMLAHEVKQNLSTYLRLHGKSISRNGMFSCLLEHNHKHGDKNPSATLSRDADGVELWFCHTCQKGGTIYDLAEELEGLPARGKGFVETTLDLARRLGIPFDIETVSELEPEQKREYNLKLIYRDIAEFISAQNNAIENLTSGRFGRVYTPEQARWVASAYTLGCVDTEALHVFLVERHGNDVLRALPFYNDHQGTISSYAFAQNRLTIAVRDTSKNVIGFVSRKASDDDSDSPRYFNTVKKKSTLFGIDIAAPYIRAKGDVYVVEGPFDCITMMAYGYMNTVASLGLITGEQVQKLIQLKASVITHVPDGDPGGRRMTRELVTSVSLSDAFVRAVDIGDGNDPDKYLRTIRPTLPDPTDAILLLLEKLDDFHNQDIPVEKRYMNMIQFIADSKKINARLNDYARAVQKYHGYTIDGILKDIETQVDKPTTIAHIETKLWKEIEKTKGAPIHEKIGKLEDVVIKLRDLAATSSKTSVSELTWNMFLSFFESTTLPTRFKTGFPILDEYASIEASELTFISGWPSHGKSSVTRALAYAMVEKNPNTHLVYLSSDDNPLAVICTFISLATTIRKQHIKNLFVENPRKAQEELAPHMNVLKSLFTDRITVLGLDSCQSLSQLNQKVLQLKEAHPSKRFVVVVDALNNLTDIDTEDRVFGIETAIRKLKRMATSTNAAFMVVNHLTKHDGRIDRRPSVANIKGSSFIEYEAKTIMLVHMDAHINRSSQMQWYNGHEMLPVIEVNVAKEKDRKANELDFFEFDPHLCTIREADAEKRKEYMKSMYSQGGFDSGDDDTITS